LSKGEKQGILSVINAFKNSIIMIKFIKPKKRRI